MHKDCADEESTHFMLNPSQCLKIGPKVLIYHEISFIIFLKINIIRIAKLVMPFDSAEDGLQPGHFSNGFGFSNREIWASFGL